MRQFNHVFINASVIWLMFLILCLSEAFAATLPVITSLGRIDESLSVPVAMDVDLAGNLWVADSREHQVLKFDQHGQLQTIFSTVVASGAGLAVEPDGSKVYVATLNEVAVLDGQTGDLLSTINPASLPEQVTITGEIDLDVAGYLFVASLFEMQVVVFHPDGTEETRFGGIGTGPGQFRSIDSLTLDHDGRRLFVADKDSQNYRVQVFDLQGNFLDQLSYSDDFGSTPLLTPKGMVSDDQGRLYFLEYMGSTVRVLDEITLLYLSIFGDEGIDVGEISLVRDLTFDSLTNRLFISCDDGRIEVFGIDGGSNPPPGNLYPPVPVVSSPIAGSEIDTAMFDLVWGNIEDPDGDTVTYSVRIKDGDEVVWQQAAIETMPGELSSVTVSTALNENAHYTWEVQASDQSLTSDWSVPGEFNVNLIAEAPPMPVLQSPGNGAITDGATLLTWSVVSDPDPGDQVEYILEVSSDEQFTQPVLQSNLSDNAVSLGELADYLLLDDGSHYWWRVTARDQHNVSSPPSAAHDFNYDTTLLILSSNIPGSQVYLGGHAAYYGMYLGEAPLSLRDFAAGDYSLIVVRPGCEPHLMQVSITERGNSTLDVVLRPAIARQAYLVDPRALASSELATATAGAVPILFDLDHDEFVDLLTGENSGAVTFYRGLFLDRKGRVGYISRTQLPITIPAASAPFPIDWDNDNRMDLLIGSADGTVQLVQTLEDIITAGQVELMPVMVGGTVLQVTPPATPAVVDLDEDKDKDLLVGDGGGKIWLARNDGTDAQPLFSQLELVATLTGAVQPMPVDWDADGVVELLVADDEGLQVIDVVAPIEQPLTLSVEDKKQQSLTGIHAAYPLDIDQKDGKELMVGLDDGSIRLVGSRDEDWLPSCWLAIDDKLVELSTLLAAAGEPIQTELTNLSAAVGNRDRQASFSLTRTLADDLDEASTERDCAEQLADFVK